MASKFKTGLENRYGIVGCPARSTDNLTRRESRARYRNIVLVFVLVFAGASLTCCATASNPTTPPENYRGPIAARPLIQSGDFWIYEQGTGNRAQSTALVSDLQFPLWVGKTWRYDTGARRPNQPPERKDAPIPAWVECYVAGFGDIAVPAGKFTGYQCDCQCYIVGGERFYQEGCGTWTIWYVSEVKNVVRVKADNPVNSLELLQYKIAPSPK